MRALIIRIGFSVPLCKNHNNEPPKIVLLVMKARILDGCSVGLKALNWGHR